MTTATTTRQWPTREAITQYVEDYFFHEGKRFDAAVEHLAGVYQGIYESECNVGESEADCKARLMADAALFADNGFLKISVLLKDFDVERCDCCGYLVSREAGTHERGEVFTTGFACQGRSK